MKLVPRFFSANGREEVCQAKGVVRELLPRKKIHQGYQNSKDEQRLKEAQKITRRDMLGKLGVGGVAAAAATAGGGYVGWHYFQERAAEKKRAELFLKAAKAIEEKGLGTVEWAHPEGHREGDPPIDPLFIVSRIHQKHDGSIIDQEHMRIFHANLLIKLKLEEQGMRAFSFEDQHMNKEVPGAFIRDGFTNRRFTPSEMRTRLKNYSYFSRTVQDFILQGNKGGIDNGLFSMCMKDKPHVVCMGSESPEIRAELNRLTKEKVALDKVLSTSDGLVHYYNEETSQIKVGDRIFDAEEYYELWKKYARLVALIDEKHPEREEYVVLHMRGDVLSFGGGHLKSFKKLYRVQGRSVGFIRAPGSENFLLKEIEKDEKNQSAMEEFLRELGQKLDKE